MEVVVKSFYDAATSTVSHVVHGAGETTCAVIDPVLDFDMRSGRTGTEAADRLLAYLGEAGLAVAWILETHVHADHLTAAPYVKAKAGGRIAIGAGVAAVQKSFAPIFGAEPGFRTDGSQFDHLFADGEAFAIGGLAARVLATPGHTPACVTYVIGDAAFVGDTLFMPDGGTARCDFPGGDAATLYRSLRRILDLPRATRIFVCHDYQPGGREVKWETTVAAQRAANIHVRDGIAEAEFIAMRTGRDAKLSLPALLVPSVQVNMRAGALPPAEGNGIHYLKLPIGVL
jgi:glyoxylase-like metal-dependent hydrolase (beta-lactamase superfamily II)